MYRILPSNNIEEKTSREYLIREIGELKRRSKNLLVDIENYKKFNSTELVKEANKQHDEIEFQMNNFFKLLDETITPSGPVSKNEIKGGRRKTKKRNRVKI